MIKRILLAGVVLALLVGGAAAWVIWSPNTQGYDGTRSVYLPRGVTWAAALDSLKASDVVASEATLELFGTVTGWRNQMKAGHYAIPSGMSNYDLMSKLRRGLQDPVPVLVPPGVTPERIAESVARTMAFTAEEFEEALFDPTLAAELGTDTLHLFAYMMPETYHFFWLNEPARVIRKIKESADQRLTANPAPMNLTPAEVLNMAAIVEWEARLVEEKPRIAGVYLNRLRDGWKLDADPTVQYAILESEGKKRRLFFRDYRIQHPYNTYLRRGLPPGPVTNPSPTSIDAVLQPEDHGYFFFVARGDGSHTFSRNLREHNNAAAAYRRMMRQRRAQAQADASR